jgi:ATP-dependent exoDNAse (exonuclease V) beta subunit
VANVIKEEFDLLVVDEFRDTNPIQLAFFIRLAELVKHGAVWVGDAKQAIYGFRGSDPALMDAVIRSASTEGTQSLNTTYRAHPELARIFNDLFVPAFQCELKLKKTEIELKPNRTSNTALPVPLEFWELRNSQRNNNGTPKRLTNSQAALTLAESIAQLLSKPCQIEDRTSGQLRQLQLRQYERSCAATHSPTTVAGFVFWCDDLAAQNRDLKAADEHADAIHVLTYHTAKGLEWPVVICDDLDNEHRTNLWDITVVQDVPFNARDPLANRRLHFWPWPFGGHRTGIPL